MPTLLSPSIGKTRWGYEQVVGIRSTMYCTDGVLLEETQNQIDNPFRLPGQYHDRETGLSYNLFRYYDLFTGRFVSFDLRVGFLYCPIGCALAVGVQQFKTIKSCPILRQCGGDGTHVGAGGGGL